MKKTLIAVSCLALALAGGMTAQDKGDTKAKAKSGKAKAAVVGDPAKGKEVFANNCAVCHNSDSAEAKIGPGLKGLTKRPKLVNDAAMTDANISKLLNEGSNAMPPFADVLTAAEKAHILAFLKTL